MATSRFKHSTGIVKSLAAAALLTAGIAGAVYAETTTTVSTQSCGWVDTSPPGLAWQHTRSYQCVNVTSTNDGSDSGSGGKVIAPQLGPNERYATQQDLQDRIDRNAEIRSHSPQPREVSLCPAPNRWTGDGCQPASYRPTWVPRPLEAPTAPDARIANR